MKRLGFLFSFILLVSCVNATLVFNTSFSGGGGGSGPAFDPSAIYSSLANVSAIAKASVENTTQAALDLIQTNAINALNVEQAGQNASNASQWNWQKLVDSGQNATIDSVHNDLDQLADAAQTYTVNATQAIIDGAQNATFVRNATQVNFLNVSTPWIQMKSSTIANPMVSAKGAGDAAIRKYMYSTGQDVVEIAIGTVGATKGLVMTPYSVFGTRDTFFQLISQTADRNAWGMLESWNLAGMAVGTGEAYPLRLYTNRVTRMLIDSVGGAHLYGGLLNISAPTQATAPNATVPSTGIVINTTYNSLYTPLITVYTSNDNPTKPKANIFMQATGSGSKLFFGVSDSYAAGVRPGFTIDAQGDMQVTARVQSRTISSKANDSATAATLGWSPISGQPFFGINNTFFKQLDFFQNNGEPLSYLQFSSNTTAIGRNPSIGRTWTAEHTLHLFDGDASEGRTDLYVRAGAAQGTIPLVQLVDYANNSKLTIDKNGIFEGAISSLVNYNEFEISSATNRSTKRYAFNDSDLLYYWDFGSSLDNETKANKTYAFYGGVDAEHHGTGIKEEIGVYGKALNLSDDGKRDSNVLYFGSLPNIVNGNTSIVMTIHARTSTSSNAFFYSGTPNLQAAFNTNNRIALYYEDAGATARSITTGNNAFMPNEWMQLTLTYMNWTNATGDCVNTSIWVNDSNRANQSYCYGWRAAMGSAWQIRSVAGNQTVDTLAIFNRTLSPAEISANWAGGAFSRIGGLEQNVTYTRVRAI